MMMRYRMKQVKTLNSSGIGGMSFYPHRHITLLLVLFSVKAKVDGFSNSLPIDRHPNQITRNYLMIQRQSSILHSSLSVNGSERTHKGCCPGNDDKNEENNSELFFELPIFPLRKLVKYPTNFLTLNLYEERYLQLADYILKNDQSMEGINQAQVQEQKTSNIFGALYCSHKAQIVKQEIQTKENNEIDGNSDDNEIISSTVTPMIQKGDIGTIYSILRHSEVTNFEKYKKGRRVQIFSIGISRFKVEEIIHSGYDFRENNKNKNDNPFILVKASHVHDHDLAQARDNNDMNYMKQLEMLEQKVYKLILNQDQKRNRLLEYYDNNTTNTLPWIPKNFVSTINSGETFSKSVTTSSNDSPSSLTLEQRNKETNNFDLSKTLINYYGSDSTHLNHAIKTLSSFACLSTLTNNSQSARQMLNMLELTSVLERFEYTSKVLESCEKRNIITKLFRR